MRKFLVRTAISFLFFLCLLFCFPQGSPVTYERLLQQYAASQEHYDKATKLNEQETYGPKEEALEKEWNEAALQGFTDLYRQMAKTPGVYDSLRFHLTFKIGELQHYFENFAEAIRFYKEAISLEGTRVLPDSLFFKPYLYAGIIFYNQNKFDTAVQFFKKAEAVQAAYHNGLTEAERLYNILGVLYYERGNYRQARNYFQKALDVLPLSNPYYDELFVNYRINLAQMHLRLEEYDQANDIYMSLLPLEINLNEIHHNIGSLNLALGAPARAISYFCRVHYQNNKIIRLYNSIGEAFFNLQQFDSAASYYQRAVEAYKALGPNTDPIGYGLVLKNLGDYNLQFQKTTEALNYYQSAMLQFYPAFRDKNIHANPDKFSGVFSYINLFNALKAKADAWHKVYTGSKEITAAQHELAAWRASFELIGYVERTYDSDEARLFLNRIKYAVHNKPVDAAFDLYTRTGDDTYLDQLYYFDQQNKAAVLSLNKQLNTSFGDLTSPHLQKEQLVKSEITRLSLRATQVTDSAQLQQINNSIRDREIELGKLRETAYTPSSKEVGNIPSIQSLQKDLLDKKTAIVSYHLSEEKLTTLVITSTQAACYRHPLPAGFYDRMQEEIKRLRQPADKIEPARSADLFQLFLSQVPLQQLDQLVIIPDDLLAYFPFETLQDEQGQYLVESVAVQYQFSTALLAKNKLDFSGAQTLSFAPFAHQSLSDSLPQLPASGSEVTAAEGRHYLDTDATKEAFLRQSNAFRVVHLATHAVANNSAEKLSYVVFSPTPGRQDNLLYTQEIYNLRLDNTGLVILSACETSSGQLVKGEGVLSLSRAFSYAGCPNIITSLWKADDFSTAYLTTRIHRYLDEDLPIAKAVQQAKKDYLADKTIHPRLKQPYFWSHLVFVGNYTPAQAFNWLWVILPALLLAGLLAYIKMPGRARHFKV